MQRGMSVFRWRSAQRAERAKARRGLCREAKQTGGLRPASEGMNQAGARPTVRPPQT